MLLSRELSNVESDRNENVYKNAIGFTNKTTILHVHHTFSSTHFSSVPSTADF